MAYEHGAVIGLKKYRRKVEAMEKNLSQLCPKCKKIVEDALETK